MNSTAERVKHMMEALNINNQTEFGNLCGASRSVVNQWLAGSIKYVDARYAFKLEDTTPFTARWIILGEGNPKK